jgi:hypothetical protein
MKRISSGRKPEKEGKVKSDKLQAILRENRSLFNKTLRRLGESRHDWRLETTPRTSYDTKHGQWFLDGVKVDERAVRLKVLRGLIEARCWFDGADVALSLDLLKVLDAEHRLVTGEEHKSAEEHTEVVVNHARETH